MVRSFLSDGGTGGSGLVCGLLAVAASFSLIAMAVFVCIGHKKSPNNKKKHRTAHAGATNAAVSGATTAAVAGAVAGASVAATSAAASASTPTVVC